MADVYELSVVLNLREDLSDEELAELRWHLGLGPRPEVLRIVPEFPIVVEDDAGEPVIENHPVPLLGRHGAAWKVGGALTAVLLRPDDPTHGAWVLTIRQEIHPDEFDITAELLTWLAGRADDRHRPDAEAVHLGWTRFHEADRFEPLTVRDGQVAWP
ncbi:hypothetical protein AQJ84_23905 [Streptomyces resistomycificus]|uniref:Uncharacterized protein n=2 Tax=Streptomyces resistomycificus TaxID=67356 RepID=A0A0L8LGT6_9ACTN|nr:hypothetical protein [Streptomyces resistomycificus]KOG37281.1 hypothetical protein ADK37_12185 [Streptomyces resistomycificus]KUN95238.1 hypothetical protein AQJ84_23905 [Streptomyces resistomycificus]